MTGVLVHLAHGHHEVPSETKEMVCRPWRDWENRIARIPSHKWPGFLANHKAGNRRGGLFQRPRGGILVATPWQRNFSPIEGGIIRRFSRIYRS
jgi:hypothetical protein